MALDTKKFLTDVDLQASVKLSAQTGSRAMSIDASGNLVSSATTDTELGYLSGVTSSIQSQLDAKIPSSEKGAANGVATLDGSGKLPSAQLPTSAMEYKGAHNVSTNSPTLIDGTGDNGDMYRVSVGGTRDYGSGNITLAAGDALIYNGSIWEKIPGEDIIQSVNGATGVVVLDTDDIAEGLSNLYYTDARFDSRLATKNTDDLAEGAANFYYTEARFNSSFSGKSTTDLSEGTNLYYTDARFDTRFGTKDSADLNHTQADAADWTVATGASIAAHLDEIGDRLVTLEGGSTDQKDVKISANDTTAGFLEDKVVVAQGSNSTNILEVSTLNDGANEDLQIQIDQSKIDHDSLLNFVANEHIDWTADAGASNINDANIVASSITQHEASINHDALTNFVADEHIAHSSVSVVAGGQDGLSVSNDNLASNIGLSVDINGTAAAASIEGADAVMIHDNSAGSLAKTTIADIRKDSAGDILETAFAGAESASGASVTGFAFANGVVRSFRALVHVEIDATADVFEVFTLEGIQRGADWVMSVSATGDDSSVTFDISNSGQITYSSSTYAGFVSMDITFRAITTSV